MNYKTYPISDLIDEIAMGPFGSNIKVDCFVDKGIPVLNGSNLEGFELSEKSFRYVTEEKADSLKKANAHKGDVVITRNLSSASSVIRKFCRSILCTTFIHRLDSINFSAMPRK